MDIPYVILNTAERLFRTGGILAKEVLRSLEASNGNGKVYAVIRTQTESCQNGGLHSPCSTYCNVPEGARYHGESTFSPQTSAGIADYLVENNIRIAAFVGAEAYQPIPSSFTWSEGFAQLKPQTVKGISSYYERVLREPIDQTRRMDLTDLALVQNAIFKDRGLFVHSPTNGIDLRTRRKELIPLLAQFVDHLTISYHYPWDPSSQSQEKMLEKFLDFASFASRYTLTKFFRVVTAQREPEETLALADRVLQRGSVLFDYGINDGKGGFSKDNQNAIPSQKQLELLSLGMLARLLFLDQMVETNLDYIIMVPAFGDHYLNCGGSKKAVLVIRSQPDGTPVLDVCSEIEANIPFPVDLDNSAWIATQNEAAHTCGGCRAQCEYPFLFNRDFAQDSQLPLTTITTARQVGKAVRLRVFNQPNAVRPLSRIRSDLTSRSVL